MALRLDAIIPGDQNYGFPQNIFIHTLSLFLLWCLMSTTPTFLKMLFRSLINLYRLDNKRRNNMNKKILMEYKNVEEKRLLVSNIQN